MKYIIMTLVLVVNLAGCGDSSDEISGTEKIENAAMTLCGDSVTENGIAELTECVSDQAIDCDAAATCIQNLASCDGGEMLRCINDAKYCSPTMCEITELGCADSPYYHSDSQDTDGGATFVLSEALGTCVDATLSYSGGAIWEVQVCLDGACLSGDALTNAVCVE